MSVQTKPTPQDPIFRTKLSEDIFDFKYKHEGCETWEQLASTLVDDVCGGILDNDTITKLKEYISKMYFIPGGRYLYYAGREKKFFNNCYLLKATEDSREGWADLSWKAERCLMTGGGIGVDYSIIREEGATIKGSGGTASGPISKMKMVNEIGREVMQGGSRRSAIYASLNWRHGDIDNFLKCKDWDRMGVKGAFDKNGEPMTYAKLKESDFNFPAPLDFTNISVNYDNEFLDELWGEGNWYEDENRKIQLKVDKINNLPPTFVENCRQAMKSAEPGFSFNFASFVLETLRNACTEVTSEDDSDVCNLGSLNLSRIDDIELFSDVVEKASLFLLCGTLKADLPYDEVYKVREKNRRLGLGLMGVHEWLLQRGYNYKVTPELHEWLQVYKDKSEEKVRSMCKELKISTPVAFRSIAPTGTIGMIAGTTTGIEPLFAVAFKRRYTKNKKWFYQYNIEGTAKYLIDTFGVHPDSIETSMNLAKDFERRIAFQADVQDYVDMSISSTINLPAWGSEFNNEDKVLEFAETLAKYAHRLRGFTCYPDGSRGGQPLTPVAYNEVVGKDGVEYKEEYLDVCEITGTGGTCAS